MASALEGTFTRATWSELYCTCSAASLVAHVKSGEKEEAVCGTGYGEILMVSVAAASENGRKHQ